MNKISNLSELLTSNLRKIYSSEQLQQAALATIKQRASSNALLNTLTSYEKTKEQNLDRLKRCFENLSLPARGTKCAASQALIDDCQANVSHTAEPHVGDAALISTFQQLNHFNIANYGSAASFAKTLDNDKVAKLLHNALLDEKYIDDKLSEIAEETINPSAVLTA